MEIRWINGASASGFYAVGQMLRGNKLVDAALTESLEDSWQQFTDFAATWQFDPFVLVDQLAVTSIEPISIDERALLAARKAVGVANATLMKTTLAGWMREIDGAFAAVYPHIADELELRGLPIREQWEARGPGLVKTVSRIIREPLVESADVILVQPVLGGGGLPNPATNRVCFEALLANPHFDLPEVVRLGWLLAQLQLDLPAWQGAMTRHRALEVGSLALVPVVLAAAEDVELVASADAALARALAAWHLSSEHAETLQAWWETFRASTLSWVQTLTALDQML